MSTSRIRCVSGRRFQRRSAARRLAAVGRGELCLGRRLRGRDGERPEGWRGQPEAHRAGTS